MARTTEDVLDEVARIAPAVAEGYGGVRELIDADGAITAARKALLVAAGAVVRGFDDLAARELERGRELGLTEAEIGAAGVAFLLMRGEANTDRFIAAAGGLEGADAPRPGPDVDAETYFTTYMQSDGLPERMQLMADRAPALFAGYHRMHHGALQADPEFSALSELVMLTVNAAELQTRFVAIHAATARRAGVTEPQLVEAIACAFPAAGIAAWAASAEAIFTT